MCAKAWILGLSGGVCLTVAFASEGRADTLVVAANGQTQSFPRHAHFVPARGQQIQVKSHGPGGETRAYLRFDLSSLPVGAAIDKAVLRLFASDVDHGGTIEVVPILEAWEEKRLTADHAPALGSPVASLVVGRSDQGHFVSVDLTGLVGDWLSGAQANQGVALVGADDSRVDAAFDSKENVLTSHAPEVEVALAGTGAQGPEGPQGPQGPQGPAGPPGPGGAVTSIEALAGAACQLNGQAGTVAVSVAANGAISLRCALPPPPSCTDPIECCVDSDGDGACDDSPCDSGLALDDADPLDAAKALGLCHTTMPGTGYGLIDAAYTRAVGTVIPATHQMGIQPGFGTNVTPHEGSSLLALSTGRARTPGQTDACGGPSCQETGLGTAPPGFPQDVPGCPATSTINDDVGLTLRLRAPANAAGFSFDFSFYSFEYPEWVCKYYNDQFVAVVNPAPMGSINGNVAFDAQHNPVSVNIGLFDVCQGCALGVSELAGTGFDTWKGGPAGATGWLRSSAPVAAGQEFTLRFLIWDAGDQMYDSTILLDHFRWLTTAGPVGTHPAP
jgi:hypothetical protein